MSGEWSFSSLNPRRTVGATVEEPLANFGVAKEERRERVREPLALVWPGTGARVAIPARIQRGGSASACVGIARALALQPELVVSDEPVSSLDVSIRAQVLNFLRELKKRRS